MPVFINSNDKIDYSYCLNFEEYGYKACEFLINNEHKNIGLLVDDDENKNYKTILNGLKKCVFNHKMQFSNIDTFNIKNPKLLEDMQLQKITALIAPTQKITYGISNYFKNKGINIPEDISIISLVDKTSPLIEYYNFTSIVIPYYEFGEYICEELIAKCEKQELKNHSFDNSISILSKNTVTNLSLKNTDSIVCVGSVNIDCTMNVKTFPQPGKAVKTDIVHTNVGGKGVNQSVGVAKLQSNSYIIGKVGNDYNASLIYSILNENNVNPSGLYKDDTQETGKAYIHLQPSGESMITILSGANSKLTRKEIVEQEKLFKNAKYCLLSTEIPNDLIISAMKLAKKYDVKTIMKPAACESVNNELLKDVDFFVPNKKEAELLCKTKSSSLEEKAKYFTSLGANNVIITLGHKGAYVYSENYKALLPAISNFKTVDATGGADAFISALAVYLKQDYCLEKAVKIAMYAAAFCISKQGVIDALIDKQSLEAYIAKRDPELLTKN